MRSFSLFWLTFAIPKDFLQGRIDWTSGLHDQIPPQVPGTEQHAKARRGPAPGVIISGCGALLACVPSTGVRRKRQETLLRSEPRASVWSAVLSTAFRQCHISRLNLATNSNKPHPLSITPFGSLAHPSCFTAGPL